MSYGILEMKCGDCSHLWNTEWGVIGTYIRSPLTVCPKCGSKNSSKTGGNPLIVATPTFLK